jgi:hypothetical protein
VTYYIFQLGKPEKELLYILALLEWNKNNTVMMSNINNNCIKKNESWRFIISNISSFPGTEGGKNKYKLLNRLKS